MVIKVLQMIPFMRPGGSLRLGTPRQSQIHLGALASARIFHLSTRTSPKHPSNGCLLRSRYKICNLNLSRSNQVEVEAGTTLMRLTQHLQAMVPLEWASEKSFQFHVFRNMCLFLCI